MLIQTRQKNILKGLKILGIEYNSTFGQGICLEEESGEEARLTIDGQLE